MAAKLSDAEFSARARALSARRSERQRCRKISAGKVQSNFWLPLAVKARLESLATEMNVSPSEVVATAIDRFNQTPQARVAAPVDLAARNQAIWEFHRKGFGLREIARRLASIGVTTRHGKPLSHDTVGSVIRKRIELEGTP